MGTIIETVTFLGGEKLEMLIVQRWTLKTSIPSQVLTEIRWTVAVESGQRTIGGVDVDEILEAELAAHPVLKTQTTLYLSHRTRCSMASTRCCGRTAEEAPEAPVPLPLEVPKWSTGSEMTIKYFSLEVVRRLQSTAILTIAALVGLAAALAAMAKIEIITITIITVITVVLRELEAVAAATPTTFHQNLRAISQKRDRRSRRRLRVITIINRRRRPVMTPTKAKTENQTTLANDNNLSPSALSVLSGISLFALFASPPPFLLFFLTFVGSVGLSLFHRPSAEIFGSLQLRTKDF